MEKFTVHEFQFESQSPTGEPGPWKISSVVVSDDEFADLVLTIRGMSVRSYKGPHMEKADVDAIEQARHIPLIYKGSITRFLFDRYNVQTPFMSVIVRGEGTTVLQRFLCETPENHDNPDSVNEVSRYN